MTTQRQAKRARSKGAPTPKHQPSRKHKRGSQTHAKRSSVPAHTPAAVRGSASNVAGGGA